MPRNPVLTVPPANFFDRPAAVAAAPGAEHSSARARVTSAAHHRRIELQHPNDLLYLINGVKGHAQKLIERRCTGDTAGKKDGEQVAGLDGQGGEGEGMGAVDEKTRRGVEERVEEYIHRTFALAKDGIAINGLESQDLDAELERAQNGSGEDLDPFDYALAQRVQDLSAQIEQHTLALANLRRTAPASIAQQYKQHLDTQTRRDAQQRSRDQETLLTRARTTDIIRDTQSRDDDGVEAETTVSKDEDRPDVAALGLPSDPQRLRDIQRAWEAGNEGLEGLRTGMGATVEKLERAKSAVGILQEP